MGPRLISRGVPLPEYWTVRLESFNGAAAH